MPIMEAAKEILELAVPPNADPWVHPMGLNRVFDPSCYRTAMEKMVKAYNNQLPDTNESLSSKVTTNIKKFKFTNNQKSKDNR